MIDQPTELAAIPEPLGRARKQRDRIDGVSLNLLPRVVVPPRLALIYRNGETVVYNPALNIWYRADAVAAEVLRWLRAGRNRTELTAHLARRFAVGEHTADLRLSEALKWSILRRLLYLDKEQADPGWGVPENPMAVVYWVCTQACNLRCTYCYQEATERRPAELSTAEAKDLIDQVVEIGAKTIVFTGGEPFSRTDLLELAAYAKRVGLRSNVITNGTYVTQRNIARVAACFDLVTISLDHGIAEHHDHHRGKHSWRRTLAALDLLLRADVPVDVNSVVSRRGLADIHELFQLLSDRRVRSHKIMPRFPMGRGGDSRDDALTPRELLALSDHLTSARTRGGAGKGNVKEEGHYTGKGLRRRHCGAGLSEITVDPEGWVYPCKLLQYREYRSQNIRDVRLAQLLSTDAVLLKTRARVADTLEPCRTCIIKNHCGGGCRGVHVSLTHRYEQSHPLFCAFLRRSFEAQAWSTTGEPPAPRLTDFVDVREPLRVIPLRAVR